MLLPLSLSLQPLSSSKVLAEDLIMDLDEHLIEVNTGFRGADVLLFGTQNQEGDLIITIKGPRRDMVIDKKGSVFGLWLKVRSVLYPSVISYYSYATTRRIALNLPKSQLSRYQIGLDNLSFKKPENLSLQEHIDFQNALIRNKIKSGSFNPIVGKIEKRGENLFRLKVHFPADVPVGTYQVETLLVKNNEIISGQISPLFVSKVGINSKIYYIANAYPYLFGFIAIILALLFGFISNMTMRYILRKY